MAQLIVTNLEDDVRDLLQNLARSHGRSIEEEARTILRGAVLSPRAVTDANLGSRFASRFAGIGLDQEIAEMRGQKVELPDFDR